MNKTLIILALFLSSCATEGRFNKYHDKHEQKAAEKCSQWYPPVSSTKHTVEVREGKTIRDTLLVPQKHTEYITIDCDKKTGKVTIQKPIHDTIKFETTRVDTVRYKEAVTIVDRAKESMLQSQAAKLSTDLSASKAKYKMTLWWAIIATAIIALRIIYKFAVQPHLP